MRRGAEFDNQKLRELRQRAQVLLEREPENGSNPWLELCGTVTERILNDNAFAFLTWPEIRSTMFVTHGAWVSTELSFLKQRPDWESRWKPAIRETYVGGPMRYWRFPASSANAIHHGYQLARFEEKTGVQVNDLKVVFEVGGGYGSLCRIAHNLGFAGSYLILDQEPFTSLQKFYLEILQLKVVDVFDDVETKQVFCTANDLDQLERILALAGDCQSAFFASWSISEMNLDIRKRYLPFLDSCRYGLLNFQSTFAGVDNSAYFSDLAISSTSKWEIQEYDHLPGNHLAIVSPTTHTTRDT